MIFRVTRIYAILLTLCAPVWASSPVDEINLSDNYINAQSYDETNSFLQNVRWSFDVSTRQIRNVDDNEWYSLNAYGLDVHKVFTGSKGDIGTLIFQPFIVNLKNFPNPNFYSDKSDWDLQWRMANFNYTGLSNGRFNIRIGHYEIPFGLEQNIDTNGTLRKFSFDDRGVKSDWGVSINNKLSKLEYEFSLSRGSGNDYLSRDDPYILSGRVGTPSHQNTIYGLSYFYGEVLDDEQTVKRRLIGFDVAHYTNQWELLSEFSGGANAGNETVNWLGEISWRNLPESLHIYLQARSSLTKLDGDWDDAINSSIGLNWKFNNELSISSQLAHSFENASGTSKDTAAKFQLRLRI